MNSKFSTSYIKSTTAKVALRYLEKDPDKNIPKLMHWWDKINRGKNYEEASVMIREIIENPDNNWYQFIKSFWTDIHPDIRTRFFENLIINSLIIGNQQRSKTKEAFDCNVPWAIVMDPTTACNLNCLGCWAAEYDANQDLGYDVMNNIVLQGKAIGIYMYIFTGGEPLVRKEEVVHLCEAHPDCLFLSFTNGTLIDEAFANECLESKISFLP